ncbi:annexin D3-like [Lolium rigidum]|uniref:annexin D3-like n=1 Tax=Lolium rigidum TaxID=89674 RepID=UPI001F5D44AF|nr:annexin D3-like [Lolium rigidum]
MATIAVPTPLPSPAADAESLRNAMQGWGTDEKALVEILGRRTAAQRAEIRRAYASVYKESLLTRLDSELSSHFQKAMILLTTDPAERDAKLVRAALEKKRGDDKDAWVLIEASCASTPDHLIAVRRVYRSLFGCSLEEDVAASSAFQQPLRTLLVSLVRSYRCAEQAVDADLARLEAATLAEAIWRKKQPHGSEVLRIVSTRSKSQLAATFQCYKEEHGSDIEQDIDNCSSQFARMLKIAVWCLTSPEKHFAEVIRYSILGLGTDEDALTRAIVSRADIDMKNIKEEYKVRFKTTVTKDVVGDCSGYYLDILLALVGNED